MGSESIVVNNVSKEFTLRYHRTLKQMAIALARGQDISDTFLALDDVSFKVEQGESIGLTGSTIAPSILWPLPLTMIGFTCLFAAAALMRIRAELAEAKVEARMRRMGTA